MNDINTKETVEQRRERKAREYRDYLEKNREKEIQRKRDYRARKKAEKEGPRQAHEKVETIIIGLTAAQLRPMVDDAKKAAQQAYRDLQSRAHRVARNSTADAPYQTRYKAEWDRGFPALQAAREKRDQLMAAWKSAVEREKAARHAK